MENVYRNLFYDIIEWIASKENIDLYYFTNKSGTFVQVHKCTAPINNCKCIGIGRISVNEYTIDKNIVEEYLKEKGECTNEG